MRRAGRLRRCAKAEGGSLSPALDKQTLIAKIIAALQAELENYARSARAAHAEATDEQNKAENKYDTRGLEAGYLARGQSRQAMEVAQAMELYRSLSARSFGPERPIDLSAVVEIEASGERTLYFVGPAAGGTEVTCEGRTVIVITPQSPLGRQLMGRTSRDAAPPAGGGPNFRIVAVE